MTFFERIEKLREKPESHRRQIAFWSSAGITGLAAIVWATSLSFNLSSPSTSSQMAAVGNSDQATTTATGTADQGWLNDNKTRIIEGWKVITN